jgi:hypothetical protein
VRRQVGMVGLVFRGSCRENDALRRESSLIGSLVRLLEELSVGFLSQTLGILLLVNLAHILRHLFACEKLIFYLLNHYWFLIFIIV